MHWTWLVHIRSQEQYFILFYFILHHKAGLRGSHGCNFWNITPMATIMLTKEQFIWKRHDPTWSELKQRSAPFLEGQSRPRTHFGFRTYFNFYTFIWSFEMFLGCFHVWNLNDSLSSSLPFKTLCNGVGSLAAKPLHIAWVGPCYNLNLMSALHCQVETTCD